MIRHRILGLGAVATSALGLLVVPFAGAQAAQPTCTILDLDFTETDSAVSHPWNLHCSNPTGTAESATFQAVADTATSPGDFIGFGGTLPVPPGLSTLPILIDVVGDDAGEPTEYFEIRFEDPEGVVQFRDSFDAGEKAASRITVDDDDGFTVTSVSRSFSEGDFGSNVAEVELTLSDPVDWPFDVNFYTQDGTATAGADYEATNETLTFAPGEVSKLASITVLGDEEDETDEYVFLGLGIEGLATLQSGGLTIVDDDDGGTSPCITLSETAESRSAPFSSASRREFAGPEERIQLTNCGDADVVLRVRGTDATGAAAGRHLRADRDDESAAHGGEHAHRAEARPGRDGATADAAAHRRGLGSTNAERRGESTALRSHRYRLRRLSSARPTHRGRDRYGPGYRANDRQCRRRNRIV